MDSPPSPAFSILDLDKAVQDVGIFSDDESSNGSIYSILSDDTATTDPPSSSDSDIDWRFRRSSVTQHARRRHRGPMKKFKQSRMARTTSLDVPDFVDVAHVESSSSPSILNALHRSTAEIRSLGVSVKDYYESLATHSVHLSKALAPRGHVDGGAMATTTNRLEYIWSYHEFSDEARDTRVTRLKVADDTIHIPTGCGFLKIPCESGPGFMFVETYYTPEIPATLVSPDAICRRAGCWGYSTSTNIVNHRADLQIRCNNNSILFSLREIKGLLFTESMIAPTPPERESTKLPATDTLNGDDRNSLLLKAQGEKFVGQTMTSEVREVSRDQSRMLWHMRLGHTNERVVSDLHKYADGIPPLPRADVLDSCPICAKSKLQKANRVPMEEKEADACWQHIQIDHGFIVQRSGSRAPAKVRDKSRSRARSHNQFRRPASSEVRPVSTEASARPTRTKRFTGSYSDSQPRQRSSAQTTREHNIPGDQPTHDVSRPTATTASAPSVPDLTDSQTYGFSSIVTHQGPIARDHKNYRGHKYNLKIKWDTGQTTWEPLHVFLEDAPDEVVEYAKQHNLLDNPDWSIVRDVALSSQTAAPSLGHFSDDHDEVTQDPVLPRVPGDYTYNVSARYKELQGIHGETCYVLISDRKSGAIKLAIRRDKSPPVDFLQSFIASHTPDIPAKSVRFDGGGDLGGCKEIHDIFSDAGFAVEVTASNSSNEIGMVERPHRTIAAQIRTMLYAAGLPAKFWPYALRYHEMIHNMIPHAGRDQSPHEICTGKRPDLRLLRVFGCRIYALPSKDRDNKLQVHANTGIFLGYKKSMRNAIYYDVDTKTIKTARHIAFDEAIQDSTDPPPYVHYLRHSKLGLEQDIDLDSLPDLSVIPSPFNSVTEVECEFRPDAPHPLGFQYGNDPRYLRAYATAFNRSFGKFDAKSANRKFIGSYILKVGNFPTFSPNDVAGAVRHYAKLREPPDKLLIRLATDRKTSLSDTRPPALSLRPVDIRRISAINLVAGEGKHHLKQRAQIRALAHTLLPSHTPPDKDDLRLRTAGEMLAMRKLANEHMTPEERQLRHFTRKNLMKLKNWHQWQAADDLQLDTHFKAGTIGHPVLRPPKNDSSPSQVFRVHWARLVKSSGVRKSRACLDGSKRAAPWLRMLVQTYSSCVDLACLRLFIGLCVNRGYYICFGDVENAYQQSPPPTIDCFLEIDDTIADWYLRRFGVKLDRVKEVIPLHRALQGHPEAGVLWERMITDILINKMGFKNTTHERNLYTGTIDGEEVLVCRQVDDFASGAKDKSTAEKFITILRQHVDAEYAGMGLETPEGTHQRYNGIDVFQSRDNVILSCRTYLENMLGTHGWEASRRQEEKDPMKLVPMNPTTAARLMNLEGPVEKSPEAKSLVEQFGFSFRQLLGELIYAYVICRPDIGCAICFLSRFSGSPHAEHYNALKGVCRYLRATLDWGLVFQRPKPLEDLPIVPFSFRSVEPDLPEFPAVHRDHLVGLFDAAHATAQRRRSVTGISILYCGVAIAWKSRVQPVTATSSTEAEFYAAVSCAKIVKYLRHVLSELDALPAGPSPLYVDNQAALHMVNESRPTPRARHIEIQHFAIQEWRQKGDIILRHIPGIINNSDDLTKILGYVLHHRHAGRSMGHYKLDSTNFGSTSPHYVMSTGAGEGVRAQNVPGTDSDLSATKVGTERIPRKRAETRAPELESNWSEFESDWSYGLEQEKKAEEAMPVAPPLL